MMCSQMTAHFWKSFGPSVPYFFDAVFDLGAQPVEDFRPGQMNHAEISMVCSPP